MGEKILNHWCLYFLRKMIILCALFLFVTGCGDNDTAGPPLADADYSLHVALPKNVINSIPAGDGPWGIAMAPDGDHIYVGNTNDGTVTIIQTSDNSTVDTVEFESWDTANPMGVAVAPDGKYVYATNYSKDTVEIIETENNQLVDPIRVGNRPVSVAVNPDGQYIYVANFLGSNDASNESEFDTVSVIQRDANGEHSLAEDGEGNIIEISVGIKPFVVSVSPNGKYVYVANQWDNISGKNDTISVIRIPENVVVDTIQVGNFPKGMLPIDESTIYVSNNKDDSVSVIQLSDEMPGHEVMVIEPKDEEKQIIGIGNTPYGLAMMPDGGYLYIANEHDHTVSVVDTTTNIVIGEIDLGSSTAFPRDIAITPDGNYIYITDYYNDSVIVIGY